MEAWPVGAVGSRQPNHHLEVAKGRQVGVNGLGFQIDPGVQEMLRRDRESSVRGRGGRLSYKIGNTTSGWS